MRKTAVAINEDINDMLNYLVDKERSKTYLPVTKKYIVAQLISKAFKKENK